MWWTLPVDRRVSSGCSRSPCPCVLSLFHLHRTSPLRALRIAFSRVLHVPELGNVTTFSFGYVVPILDVGENTRDDRPAFVPFTRKRRPRREQVGRSAVLESSVKDERGESQIHSGCPVLDDRRGERTYSYWQRGQIFLRSYTESELLAITSRLTNGARSNTWKHKERNFTTESIHNRARDGAMVKPIDSRSGRPVFESPSSDPDFSFPWIPECRTFTVPYSHTPVRTPRRFASPATNALSQFPRHCKSTALERRLDVGENTRDDRPAFVPFTRKRRPRREQVGRSAVLESSVKDERGESQIHSGCPVLDDRRGERTYSYWQRGQIFLRSYTESELLAITSRLTNGARSNTWKHKERNFTTESIHNRARDGAMVKPIDSRSGRPVFESPSSDPDFSFPWIPECRTFTVPYSHTPVRTPRRFASPATNALSQFPRHCKSTALERRCWIRSPLDDIRDSFSWRVVIADGQLSDDFRGEEKEEEENIPNGHGIMFDILLTTSEPALLALNENRRSRLCLKWDRDLRVVRIHITSFGQGITKNSLALDSVCVVCSRRSRESGKFTANRYDTGVIARCEQEVLEHIAYSPSSSTRGIARTMYASHQSVLRVLHTNLRFPRFILWSDEAFSTVETGPDFLPPRSTDHLKEIAFRGCTARSVGGRGFTHTHTHASVCGASTTEPLHASVWKTVTTLSPHVVARWIGRGGPARWPPRSPGLTPPDSFLWGSSQDISIPDPGQHECLTNFDAVAERCPAPIAQGQDGRLVGGSRVRAWIPQRQIFSSHVAHMCTVNLSSDCSPLTEANPVQSPAEPPPDFRKWGIVQDDSACRRIFSGISRFPCFAHSSAVPFSSHFNLDSTNVDSTIVLCSIENSMSRTKPLRRNHCTPHARRSDDALEVRVSVARILPRFLTLDAQLNSPLNRNSSTGSHTSKSLRVSRRIENAGRVLLCEASHFNLVSRANIWRLTLYVLEGSKREYAYSRLPATFPLFALGATAEYFVYRNDALLSLHHLSDSSSTTDLTRMCGAHLQDPSIVLVWEESDSLDGCCKLFVTCHCLNPFTPGSLFE
ncbi:hypothetical protein PR048_004330 [Dryococelus australis]|uniref:Uncharacterized protein n=1 Tax=Dryococelus australis TaxID=614101 RepID=A0ABQ9I548_9NEOP|nr:hypothetical protein PR048_004330 [Dryococelus australis]